MRRDEHEPCETPSCMGQKNNVKNVNESLPSVFRIRKKFSQAWRTL